MMDLKDLVRQNLSNDSSIDEMPNSFDWEYAAAMAADTLRLALMTRSKTTIIQQIGALGALGIELEDCKFISKSDMNYIISLLMS